MFNNQPRARARLEENQTDWFRIIVDLGNLGWSPQHIAKELSVGRSTVVGWKQGAEPKYYDGSRLIHLWLTETELARNKRPQLKRGDYRGNNSHGFKR